MSQQKSSSAPIFDVQKSSRKTYPSTLITGRPVCSAAMPVLFYSVVQKWDFRPAGATRWPIKVKFRTGERTTFHICTKVHISSKSIYVKTQTALFSCNKDMSQQKSSSAAIFDVQKCSIKTYPSTLILKPFVFHSTQTCL